jgi:aminoglycoside phosphotransferase (APT) family kinase protein
VREQGELLDRTPQMLAHGDVSPHNILVSGESVGIVDWGGTSVRSIFHDPLRLARSIIFSQRFGIARQTAFGMTRELLLAWLHATDLPNSNDVATMLKLELCRTLCADGVADRVVSKRPKLASQLTVLISELDVR